MRGVAHRRQDDDEASPAPRDFTAEAGTLLEGVAALLPVLEARGDARAAMETIILGLRIAELASALEEDVAAREDAAAGESVVAAAYAQGLVDGEVAARQARAPGPRHAGRKRHLSPVPGIPATAVRTAAVAAVAAVALSGGVAAGMHEESAVVAAGPFRHAALHSMAPDQAVAVPRFSPEPRWSPSRGPSAAAASARPVPAVTPSAPASSVPAPDVSPSPVTAAPSAPAPPVLVVPGLVDLGDSILGQLRLSVTGPGEVAWTATAADGIRLSSYAGDVIPGQPVTLDVTDPSGNGGWVYISFGTVTVPVEVTSGLGVPALALP